MSGYHDELHGYRLKVAERELEELLERVGRLERNNARLVGGLLAAQALTYLFLRLSGA